MNKQKKAQNKFKKVAISIAISSALLAPSAWTLGLGEIKSNTKLNQNLSAEIRLLSSNEFSLDQLSAKIASYEAYTKFGVARDPLHGQLKFAIETNANGSKFIQVTSNQALKEPFINFLVELNWPQGRVFREYTLLLDPPAIANSNQQIVVAPKSVPRTESRPQVSAQTSVETNAQPVKRNNNVKPAARRITPQVAFTGDSWRVGRGQTLWSIANKTRPEGASVNQTLAALYRNNPSAFINNDIDRLKAGVVLKVPSSNQANSVASNISYNDLKRDKNSNQAPLDVRKNIEEKSTAEQASTTGRLTISSVTEPDVKDSSGTSIDGAEGSVSLQGEQADLLNTVESLRLENEQLKQELESIKSSDESAQIDGLAVQDETLSVIAGSAQAKDDTDDALQNLALENTAKEQAAVKIEEQAKLNLKNKAATKANQSFWNKEGFWKWPLLILIGLLGLLGLGAFLKKRKEDLGEDLYETDSGYNRSSSTKQQPSFAAQPIEAPTEELDPLVEADILIARGKLEDVTTLLTKILKEDPGNHAVRVKLMETLGSSNEIASFDEVYRSTPDSFDHDSELGLRMASLVQLYKEPEPVAAPADIQLDEHLVIKEADVFGDSANQIAQETSDSILEVNLDEALDVAEETRESIEDSLDNSLEFTTSKPVIEEEFSESDVVEELTDSEATTKLELAKAYMAMGDEASAKEILLEVTKEGGAEQKQIANELLAEL